MSVKLARLWSQFGEENISEPFQDNEEGSQWSTACGLPVL